MRLPEKVAVVTGAGGSTGGAIARRFAAEGAKIVVNAPVNLEAAEQTRADIVAAGGEALLERVTDLLLAPEDAPGARLAFGKRRACRKIALGE